MTRVTLVPKVDDAMEIKIIDQSISYIYKVVAKILANQIKGVMEGLVGESQTAFFQGK